jgi:hypothetical protein
VENDDGNEGCAPPARKQLWLFVFIHKSKRPYP